MRIREQFKLIHQIIKPTGLWQDFGPVKDSGARLPNAPKKPNYTTCDDDMQGMDVGWGNEYGYWLAGQEIDLTGLPDGDYSLTIEVDPKMGEVYNNLGFLYHTTLQYERALEMFNQAIQTTSDSAVAYTNIGNTCYKMEKHEQAVNAWKRALELDPLNENARRSLRMYQQETE